MSKQVLIKDALIVNEGKMVPGSVLIKGDRIAAVGPNLELEGEGEIVEAAGKLLLPGLIDDQVHFREPGLTEKADIATESLAALFGGVTSYMEMPNTKPPTLTLEALEQKYSRAADVSPVNYSFYLGTSTENLPEIVKADPRNICGLKIFMGSSTGNMLVDDDEVLEEIFQKSPLPIATHCEDTPTITENEQKAREEFGEEVPFREHANIRSAEACYLSSSKAVQLARKHGTRLHVLHLTTEKEMDLFEKGLASEKNITAEVCVHHLWFSEEDYDLKGALIKWNPSVKKKSDRDALRQAVLDNRIDCIATDHAPHTLEEKSKSYFKAPSGGPLVQFSLQTQLEMWRMGIFTLPLIVQKSCHAPADIFQVKDRGYIREGYFADLVLVDPEKKFEVKKDLIQSKCKWSPLEGEVFSNTITDVWVNGRRKIKEEKLAETTPGMRLEFDR
jgi:dihydroorotase